MRKISRQISVCKAGAGHVPGQNPGDDKNVIGAGQSNL